MRTQRASDGKGPPLDAPEVVIRLVILRRRTPTLLRPRDRAAAKKRLDDLEAAFPKHITTEADRVIATLTQEIRDVGSSVAALHWDLMPVMALARGEVMLDGKMSLEQQKAANELALVHVNNRKRTIAAAMKEEKAAAKAVAKAAAKPRAYGRARA